MDTNQDYNQQADMMDCSEAETTSAGSVNEESALEEDTQPVREQDSAVITPTPAPLIMAQGYNWDTITPIPWSSSSDSSSGSDTSSLLGDTMDQNYTCTRPVGSPSGSSTSHSDTSSLLGDTMEDIPWASLLVPLPRLISPLRDPVPPRGCDPEMDQNYTCTRPVGSPSGSSTSHLDTSSLLGDTMEDIPWASLLVPLPRLISPLRDPVPPRGCDPEMDQNYTCTRPVGSPSGSSTSHSDTSSLLGDTMEDIPWASLLVPLPRLISPLRDPVPPRGCDPEMDQNYTCTRPVGSPSGSSTSHSDTSSLLGDTMDKGYTWTSLLVPNPDQPDIPRLILRRVPVPITPSGSPSGSPTGDPDMSSLLGDTMDQEDPWVSLLVPVTDRPITPQIDLQRVLAPITPSGSPSGSPTWNSDMCSLLGDTVRNYILT
ncbi:hypothetical protein ABVT39_020991 [Epinephelus coioides]